MESECWAGIYFYLLSQCRNSGKNWRQSCLGSGVAPAPSDLGDWFNLKGIDFRTFSSAVSQLFYQTVLHQECLVQDPESERHLRPGGEAGHGSPPFKGLLSP